LQQKQLTVALPPRHATETTNGCKGIRGNSATDRRTARSDFCNRWPPGGALGAPTGGGREPSRVAWAQEGPRGASKFAGTRCEARRGPMGAGGCREGREEEEEEQKEKDPGGGERI